MEYQSGTGNMKNNQKREKRLFPAIVSAVATGVFLFSLVLNLILIVIVIFMGISLRSLKESSFQTAEYKKVYREKRSISALADRDELAVIYLNGIISETETREGIFKYVEDPVNAVSNRLKLIKEDKRIKGVLLVIESPGGSVTASDSIYHSIEQFRKETGKPIVTLMKQVAASGALYVASATDYIMAMPTSITGSIGVIMYTFNFKALMDKFGVEYIPIKSSEHKDLVSPFKKVDQEEIKWMQEIVDSMLQKFISAVDKGRENLSMEEIEKLATGRVYIASEALKIGLIDEIGYFEDSLKVLEKMTQAEEPLIVEFSKTRGVWDLLGVLFPFEVGSDLSKRAENLINNLPYGPYFLWEGQKFYQGN